MFEGTKRMRSGICRVFSNRKLGLATSPGLMFTLFAAQAAAQVSSSERDTFEPTSTPLDEIVVNAQRRSENLQEVPIAVTAMNARMIKETGLQTLVQLTDMQPSLSFETAQSFQRNSLKIRGIGTIGNSRSFEGAVGVFVDGVYRSRTGMVLTDLLDIDRLELLRGPQGTLFGKNTSAGAISLWSTRPDPEALQGNVELRLGNHDARYLSGGVNVPVGRSGAMRISGTYRERDGFFHSPDNGEPYDDVDRYGIKAQYLANPTEDVEILLVADFAESDSHCCWGAAISLSGPTAALIDAYGALNGLTFVPPPDAENNRLVSLNLPTREKIEDSGITGRVTWDAPSFTLTSITGIRNWSHAQVNVDADFSPADLFVLTEPADIDSLSQEFNLTMPIGNTDLLLGLYYASEDYSSLRSVETGSDADNYLNALISAGLGAVDCLPPILTSDCAFPIGGSALFQDGEVTREHYYQDSRNSAIFAHSSTALTENFRLVLGLRYSEDRKSGGVDNQFWYDSAVARAVLAGAGVPDDGTPRNGLDVAGTVYAPSFEASIRDTTTTGILSLQYEHSPNIMAYATYQRGYKAGGVNLFREGSITDTTYAPEFADSYELGLKTQYWDGRATTNIAVFNTEFSDLQINFFTGLEFRTQNTGDTTTRGVEIESVFQLSDSLRLSASVTHLDAKFGQLGNPTLGYLDNRDTSKAPDWSAVASLRYEKPLQNGFTLIGRVLASLTGEHFVGTEVPDEQKVDSYVITDLNIGLRSPDDRWEASLWCRNCGDGTYRTIFFNTTFQPGSLSSYLNPPREYGATIRLNF